MRLEMKNVSKRFKDNIVLDNLSLKIESNEIVCLMGPSGAGKTTLLRCMNNLEKIDSGSIIINDTYLVKNGIYAKYEELAKFQRSIGLVFQSYNLFPHLSVLENLIEAPLFQKLMSKEEAIKKAIDLLKQMNLSDKANTYPNFLSGGQKQRVAIARACMLNPIILCFDEPTSALDAKSIEDVTAIIKRFSKEMSIVIVTHDDSFAKSIATRTIELKPTN
ncbi:MAG: amino acid ABC transporter ATP-binding protein [Erysipelotrichaceae bacterium]